MYIEKEIKKNLLEMLNILKERINIIQSYDFSDDDLFPVEDGEYVKINDINEVLNFYINTAEELL